MDRLQNTDSRHANQFIHAIWPRIEIKSRNSRQLLIVPTALTVTSILRPNPAVEVCSRVFYLEHKLRLQSRHNDRMHWCREVFSALVSVLPPLWFLMWKARVAVNVHPSLLGFTATVAQRIYPRCLLLKLFNIGRHNHSLYLVTVL